ncbi:MAG: type IV pilus modification PilV family protein [Phycisphaerales bacterium]
MRPRILNSRRPGPGRSHDRKAFTLLETMMALVIIGVGVLAFVDAQAAFQASNNWSSRAATGMLLANEIREMTRRLPRHDPVTGLNVTVVNGASVVTGWGSEDGEVTIDDIDDLDDLDGLVFGVDGDFPGPIDAFGDAVADVDLQGDVRLDENDELITLRGWTQSVTVEKVDPYNFTTVREASYSQAAGAQLPTISADRFPVRVTVAVFYLDPSTQESTEVSRLTWVIPAE